MITLKKITTGQGDYLQKWLSTGECLFQKFL